MKKLSLAVFFAIPFCVYLYTLHPTVAPYRDSGDLIVAASTLGIAHPPGYPLYVLTGKIFLSLLKLGNEGYVMNVMSAFFAAAALFWHSIFTDPLLKNSPVDPFDAEKAFVEVCLILFVVIAAIRWRRAIRKSRQA